jgi:hypothetical protein
VLRRIRQPGKSHILVGIGIKRERMRRHDETVRIDRPQRGMMLLVTIASPLGPSVISGAQL